MRYINLTVWTDNPQLATATIEEILPRDSRDSVKVVTAAETVQVVTSKHTLGDIFVLAHMLAKLTDGRILVDIGEEGRAR